MDLNHTLPLLLGAAWLLPLASFTLIVLFGPMMGKAGRAAGYVATGAILGAFVCSSTALTLWLWHNGPDPLRVGAEAKPAVHTSANATQAPTMLANLERAV